MDTLRTRLSVFFKFDRYSVYGIQSKNDVEKTQSHLVAMPVDDFDGARSHARPGAITRLSLDRLR